MQMTIGSVAVLPAVLDNGFHHAGLPCCKSKDIPQGPGRKRTQRDHVCCPCELLCLCTYNNDHMLQERLRRLQEDHPSLQPG